MGGCGCESERGRRGFNRLSHWTEERIFHLTLWKTKNERSLLFCMNTALSEQWAATVGLVRKRWLTFIRELEPLGQGVIYLINN